MTASPWINCSATDLYDISVIIIIIIVMTSDKLPPNKYVNGQMAATTSGPDGQITNKYHKNEPFSLANVFGRFV